MLINSLRFLLLVILLLQLGCGFHLRGSTQIPERLSPLYIDAGDLQPDQLQQVTAALKKAAVRLQQQPDVAHRLRVSFGAVQSRLLASSSPTGIELRRISLALEFRLQDPDGELLLETQQVVHNSDIELDTNNVLSHEELIESHRKRLQSSLIRSMLFKLKQL